MVRYTHFESGALALGTGAPAQTAGDGAGEWSVIAVQWCKHPELASAASKSTALAVRAGNRTEVE